MIGRAVRGYVRNVPLLTLPFRHVTEVDTLLCGEELEKVSKLSAMDNFGSSKS